MRRTSNVTVSELYLPTDISLVAPGAGSASGGALTIVTGVTIFAVTSNELTIINAYLYTSHSLIIVHVTCSLSTMCEKVQESSHPP